MSDCERVGEVERGDALIPYPRVGLDIGGTSMTAALIWTDGTIRQRCSGPTAAGEGPSAVLDAAAELVLRCDTERSRDAVGIGATGVIDPASGVVLAATSAMPGWEGTDLVGQLQARLGPGPVRAVNDVHAFALGELRLGRGLGYDSMLAITLGTGVGGAVVVDGRLLLGRHAAAGHIGHVSVPLAAGLRCPCGAVGHLEAVAGASRLLARARLAGADYTDLPDLMDQARQGRHPAASLVADYATAVGTALADAAALTAPEIVVVGGGVARAGEVVLTPLVAAFRHHALPLLADIPVVASTLQEDAIVLGAALAHDQGRSRQR